MASLRKNVSLADYAQMLSGKPSNSRTDLNDLDSAVSDTKAMQMEDSGLEAKPVRYSKDEEKVKIPSPPSAEAEDLKSAIQAQASQDLSPPPPSTEAAVNPPQVVSPLASALETMKGPKSDKILEDLANRESQLQGEKVQQKENVKGTSVSKGELIGQGLASILPMLLGGVIGAAMGGKNTALAGVGGAASGAAQGIQNFTQNKMQLKKMEEEKLQFIDGQLAQLGLRKNERKQALEHMDMQQQAAEQQNKFHHEQLDQQKELSQAQMAQQAGLKQQELQSKSEESAKQREFQTQQKELDRIQHADDKRMWASVMSSMNANNNSTRRDIAEMGASMRGQANSGKLPEGDKQVVTTLATQNGKKMSIANQIDAVMASWDQLPPDQKVSQGRQLLKTLNSTEGSDAVGAEEAKRLGGKLEFALGNLSPFNSNPVQFGRDLEGFKKQANDTAAAIKKAISANNSIISETYKKHGVDFQGVNAAPAQSSFSPKEEAGINAVMKAHKLSREEAIKELTSAGALK